MTSGMKETSSPWMPEVPESWTVLPARYCVTSRQNGSWGESPLNEGEGEFCLRAADFDYEHLGLKPRESFTRRVYSEAEFERVKVRRGDLIVEKSGGGEKTPVGRAVLIKNTIDVAFSNFLERLTVDSLKCIPEFFAYWWTAGYQSASFVPFFNQTTGIQNLNTTKLLASNVIALPESEEQYAIVELLDEECAKIDQAIDLLQQELDALEQLKKSIIYEAVTKGLDPAVPMKPSGVEWIGDIPEHWETNRLRYVFDLVGGATPSKDVIGYWQGTIPWVSSQEVKDDVISETTYRISESAVASCSAKVLPKGTPIVVVRSGILQHTLPISLLGDAMAINQDVKGLLATSSLAPEYLFYFIRGNNTNLLKVLIKDKSTVDNISTERLKSLGIVIPPVDEQSEIIRYLRAKCSSLDRAAKLKQNQMEILANQRKSLIFEYVTGKQRVSEVA